MLCEPFDQFHGRRGHGGALRHHCRRGGGGLRRVGKGRGPVVSQRRRAAVGGPRDAPYPAAAYLVRGLSAGADVLFHGPHDVGLAPAAVLRQQPCGHGADPTAADGDHHGHQPEVLHQRLQGPMAPGPQYGHPGGPGGHGGLRLQHLCPVRHDGGPGPGG